MNKVNKSVGRLAVFLSLGGGLVSLASERALVTIDPMREQGLIKRIHGVNNGPVKARADQCKGNFPAFKAAEIPSVRTHDSAYSNEYGGRHTVDISNVFPDFDKDETDAASYDFAWTDKYLGDIRESGGAVYYRLGQSIEHGIKQYFAYPPKDYGKWARICEHIIRHYNEGWANGFQWNIRHWEIWNEPDNNDPKNPTCWGGTDEAFFALYETAARHLKACFPSLMIGGPAVAWNEEWAGRFLDYVKARQVPLDFFSWHGYDKDPKSVGAHAVRMRAALDRRGFLKTESHLTEWNYVRGWSEEWPYTLRVNAGDLCVKGAAYIAATLSVLQDAPVEEAHFYDARPGYQMNALFDWQLFRTKKGYYPFYAWSRLCRHPVRVATDCTGAASDLHVTVGKDGSQVMVYIARFNEDDNVCVPKAVSFRLADGSRIGGARAHVTDFSTVYTETTPEEAADGSVQLWLEPQSFATVEFEVPEPSPGRRRIPDGVLSNRADYVVYVPRQPHDREQFDKSVRLDVRKRGDSYNDHFQVIADEKRGLLYAFWTQASWEGASDQHVAFSKSADGGKVWTEPIILAGSECRARPVLHAGWQQPMLARSGRLYCLWNQQVSRDYGPHRGLMFGSYSDDAGETWSTPAKVPMSARDVDATSPEGLPSWCNWQRPLRLGENGKFFVASSRYGRAPYETETRGRIEFWQFENIDDDPGVADIRITAFCTNRDSLTADRVEPIPGVPYFKPRWTRPSDGWVEPPTVEEASIVKLPDGRLFAVMRSSIGYPVWSQSRDGGRSWSGLKALLDRDGGQPYRHPTSPCPIYDWKGCEAASGLYFCLVHNTFDFTRETAYQNRGPLYLIAGRFNPKAAQPVEFAAPKLFSSRRSCNSFYSSYTVVGGTGVLWFPDDKYCLVGREIGPEWMEP